VIDFSNHNVRLGAPGLAFETRIARRPDAIGRNPQPSRY